jgi:hypothetical protein
MPAFTGDGSPSPLGTQRLLGTAGGTRLVGAKVQRALILNDSFSTASAWRSDAQKNGYLHRPSFYCDEASLDPSASTYFGSECETNYDLAQTSWNTAGTPSTLPVFWTTSYASLVGAQQMGFAAANAVQTMTSVVTDSFKDYEQGPGSANPDWTASVAWAAQHGTQFWLYSSCESAGCEDGGASTDFSPVYDGWPTLNTDQWPAEQEAMGLQMFRTGATGQYYYDAMRAVSETNEWSCVDHPDADTLPFSLPTASDCQYVEGANGDGNLFYFGSAHGTAFFPAIGGTTDIPLDTLRLKQLRDGEQDYDEVHYVQSHGVSHATLLNLVNTDLLHNTMNQKFTSAEYNAYRSRLLAMLPSASVSGSR